MVIGLIADESKKMLMQNFCIAYHGILSKHSIYATGSTGFLVSQVTNLKVHTLLSGKLGGVQQLMAKIEENEMDLVIYLREPGNPKFTLDGDDIVVNLCDKFNIPLATNVGTAELLVKSLESGDLDWRNLYH